MTSISILAVCAHVFVNLAEYCYVRYLSKVNIEFFDAQMLTGNAPVLTAGPWALFYAGATIIPNLSKVFVVHGIGWLPQV